MKKLFVSLYFGIGHTCTAIALAVALVCVVGFVLASIIPIVPSREIVWRSSCLSNLHQIGTAMSQYMLDYDNLLPPSPAWMDAMMSRDIRDDYVFRCPSAARSPRIHHGYAFNSNLGGKSVAHMTDFHTTPLVYASTNMHRNASDSVSSLPTPGRRLSKNNVLYVDGHLKGVAP